MTSPLTNIITELRRRRVFRAAVGKQPSLPPSHSCNLYSDI